MAEKGDSLMLNVERNEAKSHKTLACVDCRRTRVYLDSWGEGDWNLEAIRNGAPDFILFFSYTFCEFNPKIKCISVLAPPFSYFHYIHCEY